MSVGEGGGRTQLQTAAAALSPYFTVAEVFCRQLGEDSVSSEAQAPVQTGAGAEAQSDAGAMDVEGDADVTSSGVETDADAAQRVPGVDTGRCSKASLYEAVCHPGPGSAVLKADKNFGLASQCLSALLVHRLERLGHVYAVLPVSECLALCRVPLNMIQMAQQESDQSEEKTVGLLLQHVQRLAQGGAAIAIDLPRSAIVFHPELLPSSGTKSANTANASTSAFSAADLALLKQKLDENVRYSTVLRALQTRVLTSEAYIRNVNRGNLEKVEQYSGMSIAGGEPEFDM